MREATVERLLTKAELAQRLRCGLRTIDRRVGDGTLPPPTKALGRRLWRAADVEEHLTRRTTPAPRPSARLSGLAGALERDLIAGVRAARLAGGFQPDQVADPRTLSDVALLAACLRVAYQEILDTGIETPDQIMRYIRGTQSLCRAILKIGAPPGTYAALIAARAAEIAAGLREGLTDAGSA